ncbi:MAG: cbb3-type cytochrome c oxidase subunit I [Gemmatimonadaceae bacterium]|nr:cbb3-type cytochrome c oxidase subunit I [Gemmatimonadaceae bacterium]
MSVTLPPSVIGAVSPITDMENLDIRLRADATSRRVALVAIASSVVWLLLGSVFGLVASLKLHLPDWLVANPALTFGRVRTAHLNAMAYGWASLAMIGVSAWMIPRLVHTELRIPKAAEVGVWFWNIGVAIGVVSILMGRTDGLEWLEMPRYAADPFLVIGGGLIGFVILATLAVREVDHLYVSVWYIMAAYIWFPVIFVVGNWPTFSGVESAAVNWFYAHNALGLWLTPISLAAAYYFIPKILGRPIYSYQLSLLGFWTLGFFYSLNGMHHLIGGPLPTWMITTSIVASALMIIPVLAVAVNQHMTMVGRFAALRYSPTLRFIVFGAVAYTLVSLQGTFMAFREINRLTHFTHATVAHAHLGLYGFVTMIMFGSIYYILPRLLGREWVSERLISWHFWLVATGLLIYLVPLTIGGIMQGVAMANPDSTWEQVVTAMKPGLIGRSVGGALLTAGHLVFAWHVWLMFRGARARQGLPPFHAVVPTVVGESPEASVGGVR